MHTQTPDDAKIPRSPAQWQQPNVCDISINVVYAAGSRGESIEEDKTMQQSQADFAWTLCHARDLPVKHN